MNKNIFQGMIGQVCWDVYYKQINLSFNLGEPRLVIETCKENPEKDRKLRKYTRVKGQWFIWVYHAYWKLSVLDLSGKQKLTASTSDSYRKKCGVCSLLWGQKLTQILVRHETGETKLFFDLGAELIIRRPSSNTKELWLLYCPNDYCISIHGNGTYDYKPSSGIDTRPKIENAPIQENIKIGVKLDIGDIKK